MPALPPPPGPPMGGPPMGGPPMGGPPMGGPPPGPGPGDQEAVSPEEVDQLISMLLTLPPEVLQQVSSAINAELGGGDEAAGAPGLPESEVPSGALQQAAQARVGV